MTFYEFLNATDGLATIITGLLAFLTFKIEENRKRVNASKIILQEIRRAEDLICHYKKFKQYKYTEKIIANNSWQKNIHYFVNILNQDELDKISSLYSTGEYLDKIVSEISDHDFRNKIQQFNETFEQLKAKNENLGANNKESNNMQQIVIIKSPWANLLDEVSDTLDLIYHSDICRKLKNIAKIK